MIYAKFDEDLAMTLRGRTVIKALFETNTNK
jgi:hypothetical protein